MNEVSKNYLTQLNKNITNRLGKKFLKGWSERGDGNMVELSTKEYQILGLIKQGGLLPKQFHTKN